MAANGGRVRASGGQTNISSRGKRATGISSEPGSNGLSRIPTSGESLPKRGSGSRPSITPTTLAWTNSSTYSSSGECFVADCTARVKARGLCSRHYQRFLKTGDPTGVRPARWDGYLVPRCSVESCDALSHAGGRCSAHAGRARRHGDPEGGRRAPAVGADVAARLDVLVDRAGPDDCWPWNAALLPSGYGQLSFMGARVYAHRAAWEAVNGPVPDGLVLDHRCHNADRSCPGGPTCRHRRCCNPAHLEPVTQRTNTRRARLRRNDLNGAER